MISAEWEKIRCAVLSQAAEAATDDKSEKILDKKTTLFLVDEGEPPAFDVCAFDVCAFEKPRPIPKGYLSYKSARILTKDPEKRTEDDIDYVEEQLHEIPFFQRFPYELQRKLAKVVFYTTYSKGQIVIKEGDVSLAMYIVLSGILHSFVKAVAANDDASEETEEEEEQIKIAEIGHGMTFGKDGMLHDRPRNVTVKCRSIVELLQLQKKDFDFLIKDILLGDEAVLEDNLRSIKAISEFDWSDEEFEMLKKHTQLVRFPNDTVILGEQREPPYNAYFIAVGECIVEEDIEFSVKHGLGYCRLIPVASSNDTQEPTATDGVKVYKKKLEVCSLRRGHYFGIGEDLSKRFVRTHSVVVCLLIPRHMFIVKSPSLFDSLKKNLVKNFPNQQELLDIFLEVWNWLKFRKQTVREALWDTPKAIYVSTRPPFVKYF